MSRPKNSDSERTYSTIVDTALRLVEKEGPNQLSLRRVASDSGLSMGTISYYFSNRMKLIEACLDLHYKGVQNHIGGFLQAAVSQKVDSALIHEHMGRMVDFAFADRASLQLRAKQLAEQLEYPKEREVQHLGPTLKGAVAALSVPLGISPSKVRLVALTLNYSVVRFVLLSDEQLCAHVDEQDVVEARRVVKQHLCEIACQMIDFPRA